MSWHLFDSDGKLIGEAFSSDELSHDSGLGCLFSLLFLFIRYLIVAIPVFLCLEAACMMGTDSFFPYEKDVNDILRYVCLPIAINVFVFSPIIVWRRSRANEEKFSKKQLVIRDIIYILAPFVLALLFRIIDLDAYYRGEKDANLLKKVIAIAFWIGVAAFFIIKHLVEYLDDRSYNKKKR